MRFLLSIVVLVLSVLAIANASKQICNTQKDCPSDRYCSGGYCVECTSDIDCGLNEYCSSNPYDYDKLGSCQKFDIDGKDCIRITDGDIMSDIRVSNDSKCAIQYFDYGAAYPNQLATDKEGVCINGKCRICDYSQAGTVTGQGSGKPRVCVFPGKYESVHSQYWSAGAYYEEPLRVWLAVFFGLIVIQVLVGVFGIMKK